MRPETIQEKVEIPQGVTAILENNVLSVQGPKGQVSRKLFHPKVAIIISGNVISFSAAKPNKYVKMMLYTLLSHCRNLVAGVQNNFVYKLKICYVHFPVTVKVEKNEVVISNFLGEKVPRKANILDNVNVNITGEIITVEGPGLENVSQTAANIESATRITRRDRRRFQDGCYIIEKAGVRV